MNPLDSQFDLEPPLITHTMNNFNAVPEKSHKPGLFVGADFNDPSHINNPAFDPKAYEDYLEDDVLRKVEEFRHRF